MRTASILKWAVPVALAASSVVAVGDATAAPRRIVFVAPGTSSPGEPDIWSVRPDGTGRRQLTDAPGNDVTPSWSPNHRRIAFARISFAAPRTEDPGIYVMRANGASPHRIFAADSLDEGASSPVWSPDGKRIAFARATAAGVAIFTIRPDGSGLKRVTRPRGGPITQLSWSPDGKHFVYQGERGIFRVRADGSHRRRLTRAGFAPDWSPDGKRIAFSAHHRTRDGVVSDIVTMRPDGSHHRRITRRRRNLLCPDDFVCQRMDEAPAWSRRGHHLVFAEHGYESGQAAKLIVTRRDGTHARAVAKGAGISDPEW